MAESTSHHEAFVQQAHVVGSSNRTFGLVLAVFLGIVGCVPLRRGAAPRWWAIGAAAVLALLALAFPALLGPLNRLWTRFGLLLGRVMNPVIMALLFYLVVTPFAFVFRLLGKDPLRLRWDKGSTTYWINREPPGPPPETMSNQF